MEKFIEHFKYNCNALFGGHALEEFLGLLSDIVELDFRHISVPKKKMYRNFTFSIIDYSPLIVLLPIEYLGLVILALFFVPAAWAFRLSEVPYATFITIPVALLLGLIAIPSCAIGVIACLLTTGVAAPIRLFLASFIAFFKSIYDSFLGIPTKLIELVASEKGSGEEIKLTCRTEKELGVHLKKLGNPQIDKLSITVPEYKHHDSLSENEIVLPNDFAEFTGLEELSLFGKFVSPDNGEEIDDCCLPSTLINCVKNYETSINEDTGDISTNSVGQVIRPTIIKTANSSNSSAISTTLNTKVLEHQTTYLKIKGALNSVSSLLEEQGTLEETPFCIPSLSNMICEFASGVNKPNPYDCCYSSVQEKSHETSMAPM